ncbi:MAG: DUF4215 domain-containing protein [Myxococcales bacterium]|nr:DUF4215 domain-containing protein [Myxococcales bacterium]
MRAFLRLPVALSFAAVAMLSACAPAPAAAPIAAPRCGDGVLDDGEECEDGNTRDGDSCSSRCLVVEQTPAATPGMDVVAPDASASGADVIDEPMERSVHWGTNACMPGGTPRCEVGPGISFPCEGVGCVATGCVAHFAEPPLAGSPCFVVCPGRTDQPGMTVIVRPIQCRADAGIPRLDATATRSDVIQRR